MEERKRPIVAIDGPAGAGKSTVARRLAEILGYVLVDTGAMYRAVALAAVRAGAPWNDADKVAGIARGIVAAHGLQFERDVELGVRVKLSGEDVSEAIRTPDIAQGASTVSAHPDVRAALLDLQRQAGEGGGVVLEGRDIGTVVVRMDPPRDRPPERVDPSTSPALVGPSLAVVPDLVSAQTLVWSS